MTVQPSFKSNGAISADTPEGVARKTMSVFLQWLPDQSPPMSLAQYLLNVDNDPQCFFPAVMTNRPIQFEILGEIARF